MRYKIIPNFLSAEECESIIEMAKPRLGPSTTWSVNTGESVVSDYRQSEQMFFNLQENDLVKTIERRISDLMQIPIRNGEGLQVVHYYPGGYYKPHFDYYEPIYAGNKRIISRGGQRIVTVLMYLNFVEQGGGTCFPKVPMTVQPERGKAIIWFNLNPETNEVDKSTFHEAQPVIAGEKWIVTKWFREGMFR